MKTGNYVAYILGFFLAFLASSSFATATTLSSVASGVSFDDLTTALGTLFAAMATVGIFLKGGNVILRKLGFK